jgi:hypothetical protein
MALIRNPNFRSILKKMRWPDAKHCKCCMFKILLCTRLIIHWCFLVMVFAGTLGSQSYADSGSEAAVKTAFLYNFFKFIDWPAENKLSQNSYRLCTSDNDELGENLLVLENKKVGNKTLDIRRGLSAKELQNCHIVFIDAMDDTEEILLSLKSLPIVTVSDQPNFLEQGGMISLVQVDNRLSFAINLVGINKVGLHMSAQLLKLAKSVKTTE